MVARALRHFFNISRGMPFVHKLYGRIGLWSNGVINCAIIISLLICFIMLNMRLKCHAKEITEYNNLVPIMATPSPGEKSGYGPETHLAVCLALYCALFRLPYFKIGTRQVVVFEMHI